MKSTVRRSGASAFTLIELLVVMSIIGSLAGLMFPVSGAVRNMVNKAKTKTLFATVQVGISMYQNEYQRLPRIAGTAGEDLSFKSDEQAGRQLVAALAGGTETTEGQQLNPKGIGFCEFNEKQLRELDSQGEGGYLVDAFGRPFYIVMDFNYDGRIDRENIRELPSKFQPKGDIRASFAAWSQGSAKNIEDMNLSDLVATWK